MYTRNAQLDTVKIRILLIIEVESNAAAAQQAEQKIINFQINFEDSIFFTVNQKLTVDRWKECLS